jgi:sec-independent protein translocase protein TatA
MLGLDNPIHILFVLVLLLLVFGAKRLPEMGKSVGEGLRGFKEAISTDGGVEARLTAAHAAHTSTAAEQLPLTHVAPEVSNAPVAPAHPVA